MRLSLIRPRVQTFLSFPENAIAILEGSKLGRVTGRCREGIYTRKTRDGIAVRLCHPPPPKVYISECSAGERIRATKKFIAASMKMAQGKSKSVISCRLYH